MQYSGQNIVNSTSGIFIIRVQSGHFFHSIHLQLCMLCWVSFDILSIIRTCLTQSIYHFKFWDALYKIFLFHWFAPIFFLFLLSFYFFLWVIWSTFVLTRMLNWIVYFLKYSYFVHFLSLHFWISVVTISNAVTKMKYNLLDIKKVWREKKQFWIQKKK